MEKFVAELLGHQIRYRFPQLWATKGDTLREFVETCGKEAARWSGTRSCWQQQRQVSVGGKWRQCGICAACMLRRLSVHAAGLSEPDDTYVWETLRSPTFADGAAKSFAHMTPALREYAIAGVLHLEHFASIRNSFEYDLLKRRTTSELARSLPDAPEVVGEGLDRLVQRHAAQWSAFVNDLGGASFVREWIETTQ